MVWFKHLALFLLAALPHTTALPVKDVNDVNDVNDNFISAEGRYIVTLQNAIPTIELRNHMSRVAAIQYRNSGGHKLPNTGIEKSFSIGDFRAYVGAFDHDTLQMIRNDTRVAGIEPDSVVTVRDKAPHDKATSQHNAPWGLATLSSKRRNTATYHYDTSAGNGTFAYIVDTGINIKHIEFEGRASNGYNAMGTDFTDIDGHGTHCAGIIGSKTFGVAKQAQLISVKAFGNYQTLMSTIMDAYQWTVNDILTKGRQSRSVVNMSLGGPYSAAMNHAIDSAFGMGIFTVVAAGNDQRAARNYSPASAANAFTVGAINSDWHQWEHSNFGPELNIFAPGVDIESTFISTDMATRKQSGTSMAAPHVAGLALYLCGLEKMDNPTTLRERILALGTRGRIHNLRGESPNLIAHNNLH
ncbi:peptidase S8/S53 domain-containing protein [Trichoderma austrokoningii]